MRVWVSVASCARTESVERMSAGMYKVRVRAVPEKGKANDAVRKVLARHFGVSVGAVRIVVGATARKKMIDIDGVHA